MEKPASCFLVFAAIAMVAFVLVCGGLEPPAEPEEPVAETVADEPKAFTGRVDIPGVDDIYVLDNSAGRDIAAVGTYLSGRAAGLHWLSRRYFREHRNSPDVLVGVRLSIDSLGVVVCNEIRSSDLEDESFVDELKDHIEHFWRYRRSVSGKTEILIPIRWRAVQ